MGPHTFCYYKGNLNSCNYFYLNAHSVNRKIFVFLFVGMAIERIYKQFTQLSIVAQNL